MKNKEKVEIKLTRSLIGRLPNQVKTAHSLGLFKVNDEVCLTKDASVLGKINTIKHLVETKEL